MTIQEVHYFHPISEFLYLKDILPCRLLSKAFKQLIDSEQFWHYFCGKNGWTSELKENTWKAKFLFIQKKSFQSVKEEFALIKQTHPVEKISFLGNLLITFSGDTFNSWDLKTRSLERRFSPVFYELLHIRNDHELIVRKDNCIGIWSLAADNFLKTPVLKISDQSFRGYISDNKYIAWSDGHVCIYDLKNLSDPYTIESEGIGKPGYLCAFGNLLVCYSLEEILSLHTLDTGKTLGQLQWDKKDEISSLTLCNETLAVGTFNGNVYVKTLNRNENLFELTEKKHTKRITCFDFVNEHILGSGSLDGTICIWDLDEKKCLTSFTPFSEKIVSLKYANKILAAGFSDGSIYVWRFKIL